mgnify:CR=1 FL=1
MSFFVSCFIDFICYFSWFKITGNPSQEASLLRNRRMFWTYLVRLFPLISDINTWTLFKWVLKKFSLNEIRHKSLKCIHIRSRHHQHHHLHHYSHHRWRRTTCFCNLCQCLNIHIDLCTSIQPSYICSGCWHTSRSCICISRGGWLPQVLGEVWSSLGSTLSCLLPISSQSPPVTAKLDWVLCRCSILLADSGNGEQLDATQPVWGELLWFGLFLRKQPPSQCPEWAHICLEEKELTDKLFYRF